MPIVGIASLTGGDGGEAADQRLAGPARPESGLSDRAARPPGRGLDPARPFPVAAPSRGPLPALLRRPLIAQASDGGFPGHPGHPRAAPEPRAAIATDARERRGMRAVLGDPATRSLLTPPAARARAALGGPGAHRRFRGMPRRQHHGEAEGGCARQEVPHGVRSADPVGDELRRQHGRQEPVHHGGGGLRGAPQPAAQGGPGRHGPRHGEEGEARPPQEGALGRAAEHRAGRICALQIAPARRGRDGVRLAPRGTRNAPPWPPPRR